MKPYAGITATMASALLCLSPVQSRAGTASEALKSFGLAGTWSQNCATATTALGSHVTYHAPDTGVATFSSVSSISTPSSDARATLTFEIDDATVLPDNKIKLLGKITTIVRSDGQAGAPPDRAPRQITIEKVGTQIHTVDSRLVDGTDITIEDGKIRAGGKLAPLMSKCEN
jgi:hypothetical protein